MDVLEIQYIIYIRKEKVPNETIKNLSLLLLTNDVHHLFIYLILYYNYFNIFNYLKNC